MRIDIDEFVGTGQLGPFHRGLSLVQLQAITSGLTLVLLRFRPDQHFYSIGHILFDFPTNPDACGCNISLYFPHPTTNASRDYDFSNWPDPRFEWVVNNVKPELKYPDASRIFPEFTNFGDGNPVIDLINDTSNVNLIFHRVPETDEHELIMAHAQQ